MNKFWAVLGLGVLVIVMPFLGFPASWKTVMLIVIGCGIVALTTVLMREARLAQYRDMIEPANHS